MYEECDVEFAREYLAQGHGSTRWPLARHLCTMNTKVGSYSNAQGNPLIRTTIACSWNRNALNQGDSVAFYRELLGGQIEQEQQVQGVAVAHFHFAGFSIDLFSTSEGDRLTSLHRTVGNQGREYHEDGKRKIKAKGATFNQNHIHPEREHGAYSIYMSNRSETRHEQPKSGR